MQSLIQFHQALADETRWRIIGLALDEALCVCEIADILALPQSTVSTHLQVIRRSGLLESERCDRWVYYRVAAEFRPLLQSLSDHFASALASDRTLRTDRTRARKRLARRDGSCCPGPKKLATLLSTAH